MKTLLSLSLICTMFLCATTWAHAQVRAGEYESADFETAHPYPKSGAATATLTRTDVVAYRHATFISVHFEIFDLAPGDYVVVKDPYGQQSYTYRGLGKKDLGRSEEGFFAGVVWGDTALVELYTAGSEPGYGYKIDFFGRGYNNDDIQYLWDLGLGEKLQLPEPGQGPTRSLCTADDSEEAKCYQVSEPDAYEASRAVARLLITKPQGQFWCTGWLIGCDGQLMTNEHCIENQTQANNTNYEFMAEGADCSANCRSGGACGGTVEATSATIIAIDGPLDYCLVTPDTSATGTDLPATYGYMQLRESGATVDERLYLPQHPAGWGKRIALESSYPGDGGFARVVSVTEPGCGNGLNEVGYWADTQGGSSGSPVLGYSDNKVIALHHCRGSNFCSSGGGSDTPNRGVPIEEIIADLDALVPNCAIGCQSEAPANLEAALTVDSHVSLTWTGEAGGTFDVLRADGDCPLASGAVIAAGVNAASFVDDTVVEGSTYSYAVRSVTDPDCPSDLSQCASVAVTMVPEFSGLIWNNPAMYHPFYDANNNGVIDIVDMVSWISQNP